MLVLPIAADAKAGTPHPLHEAAGPETAAEVSPDGRWVAYVSNESGRYEVYVTAFPGGGEKWQVSSGGSVTLGGWPRWRHDGKELFYLTPDDTIMAVSVTSQNDRFEVSAPHALFRVPRLIRRRWAYDVSLDGQRFLMIKPGAEATPPSIVVVQNWTEELKRLVPTH